jgi:hypothetical protein
VRSYRHASASESKDALMAKRVAKRETSAERRAREDRRRLADWAAFYAALLIDFETTLLRAGRGDKRHGTRLQLGMAEGEKVFYSSGERAYTVIGRLVCEHHDNENPSKFLRLVADYIEGKEPYEPGNDWYDDAIEKAYCEACRRMPRPRLARSGGVSRGVKQIIFARNSPYGSRPSFSEFESIFRQQNPKLRGASDRSLRRSLRRLGYITRSDKRGRPKKK